jgi:MFS transporter, SHS family, sialic acid transporter
MTSTTSLPGTDAETRTHWPTLIAGTLALAGDGFDLAIMGYLLPYIRDGFHLSLGTASTLLLATTATRWLGALLFGGLASRYGRKPLLIASLAWSGVLTVASGLAPGFAVLLAIRLAYGMGVGGVYATAGALIREGAGRRGGLASGIFIFGWFGGMALSPLFFYAFLPHFGWRGAFVSEGVVLVLIPYLVFGLRESTVWLARRAAQEAVRQAAKQTSGTGGPGTDGSGTGSAGTGGPGTGSAGTGQAAGPAGTGAAAVGACAAGASGTGASVTGASGTGASGTGGSGTDQAAGPVGGVRQRPFWQLFTPAGFLGITLMLVCLEFGNFFAGSSSSLLPTFLHDAHLSTGQVSVIGSASSLAAMPGSLSGGWMCDLLGRRRTFRVLFSVIWIPVVLAFCFPDFPVSVACWSLFGLINGALGGSLAVFETEQYPTDLRSAGYGFAHNLGALGGSFGSVVAAFFAARIHLGPALTVMTLIGVGLGLLSMVFARETAGRSLLTGELPEGTPAPEMQPQP